MSTGLTLNQRLKIRIIDIEADIETIVYEVENRDIWTAEEIIIEADKLRALTTVLMELKSYLSE